MSRPAKLPAPIPGIIGLPENIILSGRHAIRFSTVIKYGAAIAALSSTGCHIYTNRSKTGYCRISSPKTLGVYDDLLPDKETFCWEYLLPTNLVKPADF